MGCHSSEKGASSFSFEMRASECRRGKERRETKLCQHQWMTWDVSHGSKKVFSKFGEMENERLYQRAVLIPVICIERSHGVLDRVFKHYGSAIVERMSACCS